jgi:hypothetical protein
MSKEIKIDPKSGQITVNVRIEGMVAAAYLLRLFEVNSNVKVISFDGNNQNDDDDRVTLPGSGQKNVGRLIILDALAANLDDELDNKTWSVELQIFQDGEMVGTVRKTKEIGENESGIFMLLKLVSL